VLRTTPLVTVLLQSIPSGAEIVDERGNAIGVTPHDLVIPAGGERRIRFQKVGFRPVDRRFQARTDTTIAVRLDPDEPGRQHIRKGRSGAGGLDSLVGTIDPFAR
jgi:hypothetical protein